MLHCRLLLDQALDQGGESRALFLGSRGFGGSPVVAAVATLVLQSQYKWRFSEDRPLAWRLVQTGCCRLALGLADVASAAHHLRCAGTGAAAVSIA
jgi:hypothetical protein